MSADAQGRGPPVSGVQARLLRAWATWAVQRRGVQPGGHDVIGACMRARGGYLAAGGGQGSWAGWRNVAQGGKERVNGIW